MFAAPHADLKQVEPLSLERLEIALVVLRIPMSSPFIGVVEKGKVAEVASMKNLRIQPELCVIETKAQPGRKFALDRCDHAHKRFSLPQG
jgi:hypothetical protein